ncbi:MAG: SMC family ATPase [Bacteroidales bacterium]|nr:SMC family ATPase [Bacteroidales bacterium]
MIPVRLTIQGLYSYQEAQTIDFTQLTQAGLFGLFGAVGSGKSSILEAITFAIYGKTERLNQSGDNRYYNMMNLKSNELLIDFEFRSGSELYRSIVKGKRNSKQFDNVPSLKRSAYRLQEGAWLPVELGELERSIGLNYDHFKRTVIIPQGRFQEFLQLGGADRTQMMKELFHLDRFEFSMQTAALESTNMQERKLLEDRLQQLGRVTEEDLAALQEQLEQMEREDARTRQLLDAALQKRDQLKQIQALELKWMEAKERMEGLKAEQSEICVLEAEQVKLEYIQQHFLQVIEQERSLERREKELLDGLQQDQAALQSTELRLKEVGVQFEQVTKLYEQRHSRTMEVAAMEKWAKVLQFRAAVKGFEQDYAQLQPQVDRHLARVNAAKQAAEQLEANLSALKATMPDGLRLSQAKSWLQQSESLELQLRQILERLEALPTDEALRAQRTRLEQQLHQEEQQYQHLLVQQRLQEVAETLRSGTACPLCGSETHPKPLSNEPMHAVLLQSQRAIQERRTQIESLQTQQVTREQLEIQTSELLKSKQAHRLRNQWPEWKALIEVEQAFAQWERMQSQEKAMEQQRRQQRQLEAASRTDWENAQAAVERLLVRIREGKNTIAVWSEDVPEEMQQRLQVVEATLLRAQIESIKQERVEVEQRYTQGAKQHEQLQKDVSRLNGLVEHGQAQLVHVRLQRKERHEQLDVLLLEAPFDRMDQVYERLPLLKGLPEMRTRVQTFHAHWNRVETELKNDTQRLGDQRFDADAFQQVQQELEALQLQHAEGLRQLGALKSRLEETTKKHQQQTEWNRQLELLEHRAENLRIMRQLFRASGFVNYISSIFLHELCHAANERFHRLSRQQLTLEIDKDNAFLVRDFLNGGKRRHVKTLSGGQTFQAALCLALALSERIQQNQPAGQHFFFLDEGFGSLDKSALNTVFETLKTLRSEQRIVGVISHVEEMQQEMETHLAIVLDAERGSLLKPSWQQMG